MKMFVFFFSSFSAEKNKIKLSNGDDLFRHLNFFSPFLMLLEREREREEDSEREGKRDSKKDIDSRIQRYNKKEEEMARERER